MAAKKALLSCLIGAPLRLSTADVDVPANGGPKWINACIEGTYRGHPNPKFPEIVWDQKAFQTIVDNLHRHPSFKSGPDGVGCARVVPWDYEHASEIAKMLNKIPPGGCPAEAWTYDAKVAPTDKGLGLWLLTEWLPGAKAQVQDGKYQFCSIAADPHFPDPVSGQDQGLTLSSVALTNTPFIQGLEPLVASVSQWGKAESAEEFTIGMRDIFELPDDAEPTAIIAQLDAFRVAVTNGTVPSQIDVDGIIDRIRRLLALPLMSTQEDVLGGAAQNVESLVSAGDVPAKTPTTGLENAPTMAASAFHTALGVMLHSKSTDEDTLLQAAKETAAKADTAESANDALTKLKTLFASTDVEGLLSAATKAIADAKQLEPTVTALNSAREAMKGTAKADAEQEADVVTASLARGDQALLQRFKPVILASRVACINPDGTVDQGKLEKFRTDYPLAAEQQALLQRRVVAGPNGAQYGGPITGYQTTPITQSSGVGAGNDDDPQVTKIAEEINSCEGRNEIERADRWLCSARSGHNELPYQARVRAASDVVKGLLSGRVPGNVKL